MSDSLLCSDIESWLHDHAWGHANAKPRRLLLEYLHAQGHSVDDRKMRKCYEPMEKVGSSGAGLFWITNAEDRRIAQLNLHSRAMSELVREKRIRDAGAEGQRSLFEEGT